MLRLFILVIIQIFFLSSLTHYYFVLFMPIVRLLWIVYTGHVGAVPASYLNKHNASGGDGFLRGHQVPRHAGGDSRREYEC
jgi:hypothetical protein